MGGVLAGGVRGARGVGSTLLCLGASGSTSGPFWPHPASKPARQRAIHTCTNFMIGVYRLRQRGCLLGTSHTAGRSESAVLLLEKLMKRISGTLLAVAAVGACAASTAALADNPAGFYLGAGVGYSTVRSDDAAYGLPGYFNDNQTAWKLIAGSADPLRGCRVRIYRLRSSDRRFRLQRNQQLRARFPPARGGVVRRGLFAASDPFHRCLRQVGRRAAADGRHHLLERLRPPRPTVAGGGPLSTANNETDNRLAYGVGVQSKAWGFAFRAEYERISSQFGDPDALTVSATWTF